MNFERIISKALPEPKAAAKLGRVLTSQPGQRKEFTLGRLCDLVQPASREGLALALGELVRYGRLKQVVRVESPRMRGGVKDFDSLDAVPQFIHDWRTDTEIEVSPDDLVILYVVPSQNDAKGV